MSKNYRKINKFSGTMLEQWRRVSSTHRNTGNINAMHFLSCYIFYASRLQTFRGRKFVPAESISP